MYATLRTQYADREQIEGFLDIEQAALWTLAHQHAATWQTVVANEHARVGDVVDLLESDQAALARFLVRCGHADADIAARLPRPGIDLPAALAAAREDLALIAEHDAG
jgi:hypothetical protein